MTTSNPAPAAPVTEIYSDRIIKNLTLKAPRSRVWRALSDYKEFGTWFHTELDGPFVEGNELTGSCGCSEEYANIRFNMKVERVRPEGELAFRWHPFPVDPAIDYSLEPRTLVEFTLRETTLDGRAATQLTIVESGFDKLPPERREIAFRMNNGGWDEQGDNIMAYVDANP
ncbi:MAG: SRPBCC family protein [Candidatus Methylacidiphilales bacterium]